MKKYFLFLLVSLLLCLLSQFARAGDVPHLVGGTIRLEDGSIVESVQFQAYIFSRPSEILTETSSGCKYENGYYWVQCGSFDSNWQAGELLIVNIFDDNGHNLQKNVTLSYSSLDTLNFILPFTRYDYTLQTQPAGLPCWIDGIEHQTPVTFSWLENSEHTLSLVSPQLETSQSRYIFDSWSNGGSQDQTIQASGHTVLTASYVSQYKLNVQVDPLIGGSVHIDPQKTWYSDKEQVVLTAMANQSEGYIFGIWSGDTISINNPMVLTMDKAYDLTASFQFKRIHVNVKPSPSNGGFITVEPYFEVYFYGDTVSVLAVPDQSVGYFFHEWGGDLTGFENPKTVVLYDDINATAIFRGKRYQLNISVEPYLSGAVDLIPYSTNYAYGDTVIMNAVPMEGYKFFFWEGDHFSLENPDTVIIDGDMNITANFRVDTGVDEHDQNIPTQFKLDRNYPNPFNLSTMISIEIPEKSDVELTVYNILGKKQAVLLDETVEAGSYHLVWNAKDAHGRNLESGVYILHCKAGQYVHQIKMMLLK